MLRNTTQSYGWVAIALHWIVGIGVIALAVLGLAAGNAEEHHNNARHEALMGLHISIGVALLVFAFARVAWRLIEPHPAKPAQSPALNLLASWTQRLLLLAIVLQFVSGPLMVWAAAYPLQAFDWISVPSPFSVKQETLGDVANFMHLVGRWIIFIVLPLHVLGALKHLVVDRDGVFQRMLWPQKLRHRDPANVAAK